MGEGDGLSRRRLFGVLGMAGAAALAGYPVAAQPKSSITAYLGSYSQDGGDGLDVAGIDGAHGTVTVGSAVSGVPDASWLAYSPDGRILYTTNEESPDGTVTALSLAAPQRPVVLNQQPTEGGSPAFVSVHPSGKYLLTANYDSGSVAVHPLGQDGRIGPLTDLVRHTGGTGGAAHAHQILADPSAGWVLSVDLGTDSVYVYRLDPGTGTLAPHHQVVVAKGTGPRHLAFHPDGKHAYLVAEDKSEVIVCAWDAGTGTLTPGQIVGTLPSGDTTANNPAEIAVSADGRFAYASNRGDNSIATFSVDHGGSGLTLLGTTPTGGDWPRHFALGPDGRWVFVANQNSGTVTWLPRDPNTGRLSASVGSTPAKAVAMVLIR